MKSIKAIPLNSSDYEGYGDVIEMPKTSGISGNQGTAIRYDRVCSFENLRSKATPNICLLACKGQKVPFTFKLIERHFYSTQVFLPRTPGRFLVIVAKQTQGEKEPCPDLSTLKIFVANHNQGVSYYPGTWHAPMAALDDMDFTMMVNEESTPDDTHLIALEEKDHINITL